MTFPTSATIATASRADAEGAPSSWRLAGFLILLGLALAPMLLAGPVPAMLDYPNHLARMSVLVRAGSPDANPYYQAAWAFVPNLAMDMLVPPLGRWIGIEAAGLAFVLLSQLLVVGGAVALDLAVKGRLAFAGPAAILLLYAQPFAWGFVNFQFGLGIALVSLAAWIRLGRRSLALRAACHALACLLLFWSHLFALGLYGWAVGLYELWRWRRDSETPARRAVVVAILAAPPAALLGLMRLTGASVGGDLTLWSPQSKLMSVLVLNGFSWSVALVLAVALFGMVYVAMRNGTVRLVGAGPLLALGFAALFVAMPHRLLDTEFVDIRVLVAGLLIVPAFVEAAPLSVRSRRVWQGCLGLLLALNLGTVAAVQLSFRTEYAAIRDSFRLLPPRAKVLVAVMERVPGEMPDYGDAPILHAPVLAAFGDAFVATLFASPGKQPIVAVPGMRHLVPTEDAPNFVRTLVEAARGKDVDGLRYIRDWPHDYDVVYVVGRKPDARLAEWVEPIVSGPRFAMYRVRR